MKHILTLPLLAICFLSASLFAQESASDSIENEVLSSTLLPYKAGGEIDGHYLYPGLWIRQSARYRRPAKNPAQYEDQYVYEIRKPDDLATTNGRSEAFLPKPFMREIKQVVDLESPIEVEVFNQQMLLEEQYLLAKWRQASYVTLYTGGALQGEWADVDNYLVPLRLQLNAPFNLLHPALHGLLSAGMVAYINPLSGIETISQGRLPAVANWEHYAQLRLPTGPLFLGCRLRFLGEDPASLGESSGWILIGFGNEARGSASLVGMVRADRLDFNDPLAVFQTPENYAVQLWIPVINIGNGGRRNAKRILVAAGRKSASTARQSRIRNQFGM